VSEVSFEATRTRGDVFNGLLANALRSPATLLWYAGGAAFIAVLAVIVNGEETLATRALIFAIAFLAMAVFYSLLLLACLYFAARKSWSAPGGLASIKFELSPSGLAAASATAQGVSGWDNWKAAFETKSLIIVRHHLGLLQIIPKRALSADLVARIRGVLRENMKRVRLADRGGS
jgi:hypothetical protein